MVKEERTGLNLPIPGHDKGGDRLRPSEVECVNGSFWGVFCLRVWWCCENVIRVES